jgi:hypothetical protein
VDLLLQKVPGRQSASHLKIQEGKHEEKRQKLIEQASKPVELESLQGKPVHLVLHGDITIKKPAPQKSLMFRFHTKKAKEILELKEIPRVHLTLEALHLRVNDTIIYERSIDRILLSRQREDWMLQVSHDVQTLGRLILAFDAPDAIEKWHRTKFRKKLIKGSDWFFKDHKCSIHDIQIRVREAIGDTIFLRAELVAEGHEQSDCCSTSVRAGDPGRRLKIRARYSTEQGTVE